jgi:CheY-like chemotaxis protein
MKLVLLSSDLMLSSAAMGIAGRHGASLVGARSGEDAVRECGDDAALLVIDLRAPGLDIAEVVRAVRDGCETPPYIMACAPHVHEQSLAAAAAAGCDAVVTRGQFEARVEAQVAQLAGG